MRRPIVSLLALVATLSLASSLPAVGKGKGNGLGQAVSNAGGKGNAAQGMNKAGQSMTRIPPGLGNAGGLGHGKGAVPGTHGKPTDDAAGTVPVDATAIVSDPANHQRQLLIEQRNRDHRLIQAQKLRELAAKNGDAELAANADRMEAFAQQHYQDRVTHLAKFGVTDPISTAPAGTDPTTTQPATTTPDATQTATATTTSIQPAATTASAPWWRPRWLFGAAK
jgi:hypothetical protein